jgi:hypothetical protein
MKRATWVLGVFFILFIIIIILISLIFQDSGNGVNTSRPGKTSLEQGNGAVINIWIDNFSRFDTLKDHKVKYLFVDVGNTGKDGRITTPESEIKGFLGFIRKYEAENDYDFITLPYSEIIIGNYDINPESFKNNFVNDYAHLNSLGFDGILVDIENVNADSRDSYLDILERLRERLPSSALISAYSGAIGSNSDNSWEWDEGFYSSVSDRVDLISASGYDSDIVDADEYKDYISNQVGLIASGNFSSYILFAVPAHKAYPETIGNALDAYKKELVNHPQNRFLGVTVFAEWTADDSEWEVFEKYMNY